MNYLTYMSTFGNKYLLYTLWERYAGPSQVADHALGSSVLIVQSSRAACMANSLCGARMTFFVSFRGSRWLIAHDQRVEVPGEEADSGFKK
jgi:hypothetical protein